MFARIINIFQQNADFTRKFVGKQTTCFGASLPYKSQSPQLWSSSTLRSEKEVVLVKITIMNNTALF